MRNRWETSGDGGLDDPVTITERQLRSLKRGARAGLFAFILALAAAGVTGWTSVEGGRLNLFSALRSSPANGGTEAATGAPVAVASQATADSARGPAPAATVSQPVPAAAPANQRGAATVNAAARPSKSAHAALRDPEPVTESFQASSPAPASIPTRDPVPVSVDSRKPASHDSSAANH